MTDSTWRLIAGDWSPRQPPTPMECDGTHPKRATSRGLRFDWFDGWRATSIFVIGCAALLVFYEPRIAALGLGAAIGLLVGVTFGPISPGRARRRGAQADGPPPSPSRAELAESLGDLFAAHSPDGRFTYVSSGSSRLLGYEPGELLGRHPCEFLHVSSRKEFEEMLTALSKTDAQSGRSRPIIVRMHHKGGWQVWVEIAGQWSGSGGEIVCVFRDVTLHKLAVEALRTQERAVRADRARLNMVISQLPALIWTTDADFRICSFAGRALQSIPLTTDDAVGRTIGEVLDTPSLAGASDANREGAVTVAHRRALLGDSVGFDLPDFHGCGRDLNVMIEPLFDEDRAIAGCVGLALDVTERRRAMMAERERCDLQHAVTAMEQVLTVIGHELRTPLAALRAMSEHLLDESEASFPRRRESSEPRPPEPDSRLHRSNVARSENAEGHDCAIAQSSHTFLHSIHDEVIRLSNIVNDLLDAASVSHEAAHWDFTSVSLSEVCEEAVRSIAPLVDQRQVRIECKVEPHDLSLNANPRSLSRLVINLLSNAQRHTERGAIVLRANRVDQRFIELTVRDTGVGIPQRIANKLGVPFALSAGVIGGGTGNRDCTTESAEGRIAQVVIGSGLGLAICNRIAAAHGGSLRIDSQVGRGTQVTVRLRADLGSDGLPRNPLATEDFDP